MGKGKKKSGGGAAAAPAGPAIASDETLASETLDAIELRHELELAEVKKVTAGMTGKKDAMQVLHIEGEVTDRHYLEMRRWEELHEEGEDDGSDPDPDASSPRPDESSEPSEPSESSESSAARKTLASLSVTAVGDSPAEAPVAMTKAMRRRLKKDREERERDERVARETAEARASGPSAGEAESAKLATVLGSRGLRVREMKADGHCLYRAIADQLIARAPAHEMSARLDPKNPHETLRALAARVMRADADAYRPFLETEHVGADADAGWSRYLSDVESTAAWGGQLELQALATGLRVPVEVLTADAPPAVMGEAFLGETDGVALRVCHHRRAFGLGEHYNSAADE